VLDKTATARAIGLQEQSYELLRWMADGVASGFIQFRTAHRYATLPEAAHDWIIRHYNDIPIRARPAKEDLGDFSRLFSTYLENSFDLIQDPGKRLHSPDAHCFCPICSWLVEMPNLRTKKIKAADKRRAQRMTSKVLDEMAFALDVDAPRDALERLGDDDDLREAVAMVTWAHDLQFRLSGQVRLDGQAVGAAPLVLWRRFAWTPKGSPKKNFRPTIEAILQSEKAVADAIQALTQPR
jgi:hypothetical protein